MKKYINMGVLLIVSAIVGTILLVASYSIPVEKMRGNMQESVGIFAQEGFYPELVSGYGHTRLDNYTDALMLNIAFCNSQGSIIDKAMNNAFSYGSGPSWLEKIAGNNGEIDNIQTALYFRYWHGYLVFLKPLLTQFNYQEIRIINGFVQGILLAVVLVLLSRRVGIKGAGALAAAVFFLNPAAISLSMQFSTVYYPTLVCMILLLAKREWLEQKKERYEMLFMLTGVLVAYFDLLTYPLVSLGIPLVTFFMLNHEELKKQILSLINLSIAWCVGYAGMWIGKWCMFGVLTGGNAFLNAAGAAKDRTSGNALDAIRGNLSVWKGDTIVFMGILILIIFIVSLLVYQFQISVSVIPLACICCYPFVWYMFLDNHSTVHAFFTYRNLSIPIFAILGAGITCTKAKRRR